MHSTCTVSHSCFLAPRSQTSSLFPYTTLFRSIVVVVVGLTIAVALIPLSLVLAIVVGAVAALLGCTLAYVSSPVLRITGTHFSMGRARIEVELLGEIGRASCREGACYLCSGDLMMTNYLGRGIQSRRREVVV